MDFRLKRKPTKIEEMSKEQIREAILKKRECTMRAQTIVESFLENSVEMDYFLKCLPDINQSHFDDVIEERLITHLCGYPLCNNKIFEKDMPKQKYKISTKTNKVYDITARKSFCSNTCYKSAMYVKQQLLTSPLWLREYEDIPRFNLLPRDTRGSLGEEVDLSMTEKVEVKQQLFTSINDFASTSLQEISPQNKSKYVAAEVIDKKSKPSQENSKKYEITETVTKLKINNNSKDDEKKANLPNRIDKEYKSNIKDRKNTKTNPLNIIGDIIEKPEGKIDTIITNIPETIMKPHIENTKKVKEKPTLSILNVEVEKRLAEWFSLDTLIFIFGEEKVKEMVADKGDIINKYLNTNSIAYSSNSYDQYQQLCRKLNMLELGERKLDEQTLQRETKPLPDYSILKEESKKLQLKIKAFYCGETEIIEPTFDKDNDESLIRSIPLVDRNAQNALRRRIVLQHLNKAWPDLLRSLGLQTFCVSSEIKLLVNTFNLKANNIMFKPIQWTLIAIILIKLLSLRDGQLKMLLRQPKSFQHLQLLLLSYKQDGEYLDRLVLWLTNVDRLLDDNPQLTVE